jgi:outer membrane protein TolC
VTITTADRKLKVLHERQTLVQARFNKSNKALAAHTVTIETVGPDLTSLMDVNSQIAQLERTREDARISLNALLGLHPDVDVRIATPATPQPISEETIARAIDSIALRRPDLLALRAGYEAQEGQLQQAILAQFPSLNIGLAHAKDTTGVQSINVGVTLGLPLFNGNRGEIAVQAATRDQLRQEYLARIDQTVADIQTLKRRQALLARQIWSLRKDEPVLADMVKQAQAAYANGSVTSLVLLNLESNLSQKRLERLDLEEALWTARIALEALLALPAATSPVSGGNL